MTDSFELHPDLQRDGLPVLDLPLSRVLLMDDASYPWLILVPRRPGLKDFHDLDREHQHRLCDEISHCSQALQSLFKADKINVAALGNVTPQLHVHVIARFTTDAAWPAPVWGKVPARPYDQLVRNERLQALTAALGEGLFPE